MNALLDLIKLSEDEKTSRGLLHTPAEIAQQPQTWKSTFQIFRQRRAAISQFLSSAGICDTSTSKPTVFLLGAGTSDYVGQSLTYLLRRKWGCEVIAVPSTDLLTHFDQLLIPERHYLWISFSRSGDSPEGVAGLELALKHRPDIHHLVVSCNANGRMVRENTARPRVLSICLDDAVNDRGLAMTSSFSNMVVFGQCLAHVTDSEPYESTLGQLVEAGQNFLAGAANCASELAKKPFTKACFVGSGPLRAVARESALKLLELTAGKVLTMSESALGLRHGPMAALDENTLFVCFLSGDQRVRQYEIDLLNEIGNKRLVRTRIAVGGGQDSEAVSIAEHHVRPAKPPAIRDDYCTVVDVIFGQLLGLFFSLRCGLRPDCPSPSGAITRVVQNFNIHV